MSIHTWTLNSVLLIIIQQSRAPQMFACLQSLKAQKLGTTFRVSNSGCLGETKECTFLTSSQVTPVTSLLLAQGPHLEICCGRGMLMPSFSTFFFFLYKLPGPGLKKLWTICVIPEVLTSIVMLIFLRWDYTFGAWMWLQVGQRWHLVLHSLPGLGCGSAQESSSTWAIMELSLPSLILPVYPEHLK